MDDREDGETGKKENFLGDSFQPLAFIAWLCLAGVCVGGVIYSCKKRGLLLPSESERLPFP